MSRGGRRPGAGRPALPVPTDPASLAAALAQLAGGKNAPPAEDVTPTADGVLVGMGAGLALVARIRHLKTSEAS